MIIEEENYLKHYGILRRSGRYPWGSGNNPYQRSMSFFDHVDQMKKQGLSEKEIATGLGFETITEFRKLKTLARAQQKQAQIAQALKLKEKGLSNVAAAEKMGIPESTFRTLIAPGQKEKVDILDTTANMLRDQIAQKGVIDIGKGVETQLGISKEKLQTAASILKDEGYEIHTVQIPQQGTNQKTTTLVLAPEGTSYRDIVSDLSQIRSITDMHSEDHGRSFLGIVEPLSIDSKRVGVNYAEDGGAEADGVIYVRPGVKDVSLGGANYAQVRIAVDGTHYLKGMAMYKDDLPPGVDLLFNTNKAKADIGSNKLDAMKPMKDDPDNPFGSVLKRQILEKGPDGKDRASSAMNIVNEEGDWGEWKKRISSQVLSKQSPQLAKEQLDKTYEESKRDLEEILSLNNPAVRSQLLQAYADNADSAAVHLKAAALPKQASQVILPINTMKETEIFAPNFENGERVALIRYPHGGTFEIPELTVNNNHPDGRKLIGSQAKDAVGINHKVAERLSGADFDGDTVLVIPNPVTNPKLKTSPPLADLKGFDPQKMYKLPEGQKFSGNKQQLMGDVSNLITDMTIMKAPPSEIAKAVKHSMVVIDAEKHDLDYKRSAIENGIPALKEKYQGRKDAGASTLISRAGSRDRQALARRLRPASKGGPIDKATGKLVWEETGESWINAKGERVYRKESPAPKKLAITDDAFTLVSKGGGTPIERVYANHSNRMKDLANKARKEFVNTEPVKYSPSANKHYKNEVESLTRKLNDALRNAPRERQAQILAGSVVKMKKDSTPNMEASELKKVKSQALIEARARAQAKKPVIKFEGREWEAVQAGAIHNNRLVQILKNADIEQVRTLATPRVRPLMSGANLSKAKSMAARGYTQAEIASALGIGLTTLKEGLKNA